MDFSSDIPSEISRLLADLYVLKCIPVGHKYNVTSNDYSNAWTLYDKLIRFVNGENAQKTMSHIHSLIDLAITLSRENSSYANVITDSVCDLTSAIGNLSQVYAKHPGIQGELMVISMRIKRDAFTAAISRGTTSNIPQDTLDI